MIKFLEKLLYPQREQLCKLGCKGPPYDASGYDPLSMRVLFTKDQLLSLPFKQVTADELYELKCSWFFNPPRWYPKGIDPLVNERGHDQQFRYLLK